MFKLLNFRQSPVRKNRPAVKRKTPWHRLPIFFFRFSAAPSHPLGGLPAHFWVGNVRPFCRGVIL
jgi:hypothetical protein